jgi:hypothetical protein
MKEINKHSILLILLINISFCIGQTLTSNTTGSFNVAVGVGALQANTTASYNTAVGYQAAYNNTTGAANTAVGNAALKSTTTAVDNTAVGSNALNVNTTGSYNTAVGSGSLQNNSTSATNTAVGYEAGYYTTGNGNSAFGFRALSRGGTPATGTLNTAIGQEALYNNTSASNNTALGYQAGYSNTTGTNNNFFGSLAGYGVTTGSNNLALGSSAAGSLTTGSNNIYVGYSFASSASVITEVVMAFGATGKGTGTSYIQGSAYQTTNAATWSVTSDQRLKKNIVDNNTGLGIINQIQVRNFEYRLPEEITDVPQDQAIAKTGVQLGVIAQELQQILPECVKTESTGVMTVDADNLTWYLINAVKELTARVAQLEAKGA